MKNLENVVGLQEMNLQEMREVSGGNPLIWKIIEGIVKVVVMADAADRIATGWNEAGDSREFR